MAKSTIKIKSKLKNGWTDKTKTHARGKSLPTGGWSHMPVIPTARFESDIGNIHLLARNRSQIAIACEILRIGRIGLADGKDHLALESGLGIFAGRVLGPHALGQIECRPCLRPTGVETDMGDNLGYLGAGDTVSFISPTDK